jgi:hypothetical protein
LAEGSDGGSEAGSGGEFRLMADSKKPLVFF